MYNRADFHENTGHHLTHDSWHGGVDGRRDRKYKFVTFFSERCYDVSSENFRAIKQYCTLIFVKCQRSADKILVRIALISIAPVVLFQLSYTLYEWKSYVDATGRRNRVRRGNCRNIFTDRCNCYNFKIILNYFYVWINVVQRDKK